MRTESVIPNAPGVYRIIGPQDQVYYVGSTGNLRHRFYSHRHMFKKGTHHCDLLVPLWRKDPLSFRFVFKETATREESLNFEQQHLDELFGNGTLLNKTDCATGYRKGYKMPPETIARQAAARRGKPRSEETKEKIRRSNQGQYRPWLFGPRSEEHKRRQSESLRGRSFSEDHRAKISKARSRPVVIDGKHFDSAKQAAEALGIGTSEMNRRLNGDRYTTWKYSV